MSRVAAWALRIASVVTGYRGGRWARYTAADDMAMVVIMVEW